MYVDGFYSITSPESATFYVTSDTPSEFVKYGWKGQFFPNIAGRIQITSVKPELTQDYKWLFTFQTDTNQSIEGTKQVHAAIIKPPDKEDKFPVFGSYTITNGAVVLTFDVAPPVSDIDDWTVFDLPSFKDPLKVSGVSGKAYILRPRDGSQITEDITSPVKVKGFPVTLLKKAFTPGTFLEVHNVDVPALVTGNFPPLRNLNRQTPIDDIFKQNDYKESRGRGFSSGSVLALEAIGPQEAYLLTDNMTRSQWNPEFKRHTNFSVFQRIYNLPVPSPSYEGNTVVVELKPNQLGHLMSNMYLNVKLPALPDGFNYTNHVGRALIQKVELLANETVIETLYDDWYFIRDQLFLTADDIQSLYVAIGGINISGPLNLVIPLEFFFCRRHSARKKERERLSRPYLPTCAMWAQKLYVRFTFHKNTWWSNSTDPNLDLLSPALITEEILLENTEKVYYQNTERKFIINRILRDGVKPYDGISTRVPLSANYPVQLLSWFFRNKMYENENDRRQYNNRYRYGYATQYVYVDDPLQFPSGNVRYIDVVQNARLTLDNVDITSTFQGSLYWSFKQPMEHSLSIPSKNIYMYSFGLSPKEYNEGGYLNFAKLNTQTTYLTVNFKPQYISEIAGGYNMYVYYFGYSLLRLKGGYASVPLL